MEKTQNIQKTEAELHADLVVNHLNDLEGIKAEVIKAENYEAANVLTKSISLIKSSHISNDFLSKENIALKANLRLHLAGMAMCGMINGGTDGRDYIPERAFGIADEMLEYAKKEAENAKERGHTDRNAGDKHVRNHSDGQHT